MTNIKVLDCTLRDGGYVNEWNFGKNKISTIIKLLNNAGVDYIETGFITNEPTTEAKTLFNSFNDIEKFVDASINQKKLFGMITYGRFPIEDVPNSEKTILKGIRLIFKKNQRYEALEYCRKLKDKGFTIFINPTFTDQYSDMELIELINIINDVEPYGISIVDSMGILKEKELLRLYYIIDNNLKKNISLCFHSHNNLQLSFSNAQCLMKVCKDRELVIDSTVFGMGRGAGNLCTELLTQYINDNYGGNYDIVPILKIVDEQINPIFAKTPWGYSVPYYLAATNHAHPNYAKYLVDKQTVAVEFINEILKLIPDDKKATYDEEFIKQLYLDNLAKPVDDSNVIDIISKLLVDKKILVLAPGKSLKLEEQKIKDFIFKNKPFVISLNFEPKNYISDMIFVTNSKRFSELPEQVNSKLVVTSNIENVPADALRLNYSTYLNSSQMYDNVALMLFKLFIKINIKEVSIAGMDGFSKIASENYVLDEFINNSKLSEFDTRNIVMSEELKKIKKDIKLNFLTKSLYNV